MTDITKAATISGLFEKILKQLNVDLTDPDFRETPLRVTKVWIDLFSSFDEKETNQAIKTVFEKCFPTTNDQMISFKSHCYSLCPHHLLPVEYNIYTAYIPKEKAIGLSKIPRVIKLLAKKPALQENLTTEITNVIMRNLKPLGVACVVEGKHLCMCMRGVEQVNSLVITSDVRGVFKTDSSCKAEFMNFINQLKK